MEFRGSHGRRDDGVLYVEGIRGAVAECFGSGLGDGFVSPGKLMVGTVDCEELLSSCMVMNGISGPSSGRFIVGAAGAETVTSGRAGVVWAAGPSSGKFIVGTTGAETVNSGTPGAGLGNGLSPNLGAVGTSVSLTTGPSKS